MLGDILVHFHCRDNFFETSKVQNEQPTRQTVFNLNLHIFQTKYSFSLYWLYILLCIFLNLKLLFFHEDDCRILLPEELLYVLKKCFDRVVVLVLKSLLGRSIANYILWRLWQPLSLSHIVNSGFLFDWKLFLPLSHHFL